MLPKLTINDRHNYLDRFFRVLGFSQTDTDKQEVNRYKRYFRTLGCDSDNPWIRKSSEIPGWLFPGEHELLWQLAYESPSGHVLEVGSWMGKSACILAGASAMRGDGSKVFCVDPFDMRGNDWQQQFHQKITDHAISTFDQFIAYAQRLDFYTHVVPVAKPSEDVLFLLQGPWRLVFLDGRHEYEQAKLETLAVTPHIVPGGFLALHDATDDFPGVKRFAAELGTQRDWESVPGIGTIAVFRRIPIVGM